MANTYTPTYNLLKPEVGADTNAWGTHLNSDLDTIDANMVSRILTSAQTFAGAINLPSDGLNVGSGQLRVNGGNVSMTGQLTVTGAATLSSTLTVGSTANLQGAVNVTGATALASTLSVTGATILAANGLNVGTGQLQVTGGNVNMSGALNVTGAINTGAATLSSLSVGNVTSSGTVNAPAIYTAGTLTIQNTAPTIYMNDTDNGNFRVHCNSGLIGFLGTAGGWLHYVDNSGNFTATGNVTAYSDAKLKKNVVTIDDAMGYVNRMRGVFYDRIEDDKPGVGVIAQEMQAVLPQVIHENDGTLSVAYGNIVGVLIEAVKSLDCRLASVEAR